MRTFIGVFLSKKSRQVFQAVIFLSRKSLEVTSNFVTSGHVFTHHPKKGHVPQIPKRCSYRFSRPGPQLVFFPSPKRFFKSRLCRHLASNGPRKELAPPKMRPCTGSGLMLSRGWSLTQSHIHHPRRNWKWMLLAHDHENISFYYLSYAKSYHMILLFHHGWSPTWRKKHVFFVVPKASIWGGVHLDVCEHFFFWAPESWVSKNQPTRGWFKQKSPPQFISKTYQKENTRVCISNSNALEFARRNFWIIFGEDWRNLLGVKSSWSLSLFDCEHLPIFQYTIPSLKLT